MMESLSCSGRKHQAAEGRSRLEGLEKIGGKLQGHSGVRGLSTGHQGCCEVRGTWGI